MQKIKTWIWNNKLRLLLGTLLVCLEMIIAVFPIGLGYNYKKLLLVLGALTWIGILVKIPAKIKPWLGTVLLLFLPGVQIVWLEKMTETVNEVSKTALFYNVVIAYLLTLIVLLVTLSLRATIISMGSFLTILYTVNYFVYLFRGKAFSVYDILAAKTVARVVGNYDLTPNNIMVVAWCFFLFFLVWGFHASGAPKIKALRKKLILRMSCAGLGLLLGLGGWIAMVDVAFWEKRDIAVENGFYGLFYSDGFLVSTCIEIARDKIVAPDGYSPEAADALLAEYETSNNTDGLPHIIMIMNESFADLRIWGDLQMSTDCLPFYNSLTENTVRGYVNASVLGGGTANSEFEVLTGSSMGLLPAAYYPYQQCITEHTPSMVSALEKEGYTTYSIHPENSANWNRVNVYRDLGFDYSYWLEDFPNAEIINAGVSDEALFGKIITLYENRQPGERLFSYNVTMQNHGGYTWTRVEETVSATNLDYQEMDMYLSLIKTSDEAFEKLVNYFSTQEEKVIICMFGDHQPKFDETISYDIICAQTEGITDVDKRMNLYKTPFVIWANYDIEEAQGLDIGMNYLGALTMKNAGVNSYSYFNYLNNLMEEWPIITINGILDNQKQYYSELSKTGEALQDYRILQYHQLFGLTK